jgi:hypothetical protein
VAWRKKAGSKVDVDSAHPASEPCGQGLSAAAAAADAATGVPATAGTIASPMAVGTTSRLETQRLTRLGRRGS